MPNPREGLENRLEVLFHFLHGLLWPIKPTNLKFKFTHKVFHAENDSF